MTSADAAMRPTFRFAPSPNGHLHLGHVKSALVGYEMARRLGGRFLVRIEDTDVTRCRPEFIASIIDDLTWLGLTWERPVRRQSRHFADYQPAVRRLLDEGLLYRCFLSRSKINLMGPDAIALAPGSDREVTHLASAARQESSGEPFALRLHMDRALARARQLLGNEPLTFTELDAAGRARTVACRPELWGDAVIVRKEVPASYHLAVVIDDAAQRVTHVTRGLDVFPSTDVHRLLQVLLGLPAPLYHHHALIMGDDGRKLSKSAGSPTLKSLRANGLRPEDVRAMMSAR
jgi:glutamyl-Q tRNA(Asp) synthetase